MNNLACPTDLVMGAGTWQAGNLYYPPEGNEEGLIFTRIKKLYYF